MQIKILTVIDNLGIGGKERRVVELIKGFAQQRDIVSELVVLADEIHYQDILKIDTKVTLVPRKRKRDLSLFPILYRITKTFGPHIMQSFEGMTSIYCLPVAKLLGVKFINAMITDAPENLKYFSKRWVRSKLTFPFSDVILANSHAGLKAYNAPTNKSVVIHNGFDLNRISNISPKAEIRKKFSIKTKLVVGMIASFSDFKDYDTYLSAAKRIRDTGRDVTFVCIGDGKNLKRYKQALRPEYYDYILFLGVQSNVESIINIFNVGVLCTFTEGISNAIIEYMVMAKPVIATDGGGTKELVINQVTGYLIDARSVDTLVAKLEYLLDHETIAKEMGVQGKNTIYNSFSLDKMVGGYISLYEQMIKH